MTHWKRIDSALADIQADVLHYSPTLALEVHEVRNMIEAAQREHEQDAKDLAHVVQSFEDIYSRQYAKGAQAV